MANPNRSVRKSKKDKYKIDISEDELEELLNNDPLEKEIELLKKKVYSYTEMLKTPNLTDHEILGIKRDRELFVDAIRQLQQTQRTLAKVPHVPTTPIRYPKTKHGGKRRNKKTRKNR